VGNQLMDGWMDGWMERGDALTSHARCLNKSAKELFGAFKAVGLHAHRGGVSAGRRLMARGTSDRLARPSSDLEP